MNSRTVSAELGLRLVVPQQTIVPLVASLYYSSDDPYAIRIAFHVGLDEPVDVRVWPSAEAEGGAPGQVLNLELSSPFGQAHFEAPARDVADFLTRAYRLVPAGRETDHVNVDAELTELLREA
jgi:hypothetical protein